jgi:hypothetical protein
MKILSSVHFEWNEFCFQPADIPSGEYRIVDWPNDTHPDLTKKFKRLSDLFDSTVCISNARFGSLCALSTLQANCSTLCDDAVRDKIGSLKMDVQFDELGANWRMLNLLAKSLSVSRSILCCFDGCDPNGVRSLRALAADNIGGKSILEIDKFRRS